MENIAPVDPDAALDAIEAAVVRGSIVRNGLDHRHRVVSLLRSLAYEPQKFDKAASLITRLTEGEPASTHVGAAVNVFKSLFHLYLSGTHASAKQRANYLRALAASNADNWQQLVISGLDAMINNRYVYSSYSFEFGTRKRDYGFHPKTEGDIQDWYREAFTLAGDLAEHAHLGFQVRGMIAQQSRFLASRPELIEEFVKLADRFAANGGWPEGWAGVRAARAMAEKEARKIDKEALEALEKRLNPNTLEARIATYVLPQPWNAFDAIETGMDGEQSHSRSQEELDQICEGIGMELAADLSALARSLPSMLSSGSGSVATVATTIGRECREPRKAWDIVLSAILLPEHGDTIFGFPSAFLEGLVKTNPSLCNRLLDESLANAALHRFFVTMQASAGLDEAGVARMLEAVKQDTVPVHSFSALGCRQVCDELGALAFESLVLAIAKRDGGLEPALRIFHMRLLLSDKRPVEPEERKLARALLRMVAFDENRPDVAHILAEIVRQCLSPSEDYALADVVCERLSSGFGQYQIYSWNYAELIRELSAIFPRSVLNIMVEKAPRGWQGRREIFRSFHQSGPCPLQNIADDVLLEWAHERPETRFFYLAEVMHPWQSTNRVRATDNEFDEQQADVLQWTSAALRVLREAPDPLAILNQYVQSFRPSGWSGSLAGILDTRVPLLQSLEKDDDQQIAVAAAAALASFKESIQRERTWEAHDSRERDERFEW